MSNKTGFLPESNVQDGGETHIIRELAKRNYLSAVVTNIALGAWESLTEDLICDWSSLGNTCTGKVEERAFQ